MEQDEKKAFSYTYSAKQQEEIQTIRRKYMPPEEDKMEQLRKLDASVSKKATIVSILVGLIGTLTLGFGMSLVMTTLSSILGIAEAKMLLGVLIGIIGMLLIGCAYPVYTYILKKERKRVAPEILRLTDELLKI